MFAKESSESFFFPLHSTQNLTPPCGPGYVPVWKPPGLVHNSPPLPKEQAQGKGRAVVVVVAVAAGGGSPQRVPDHVPPQRHLLELEAKRWARAAQRGLN